LAEASATKHSVARYREFVRFLEHAFARPLNQLEKKLSQFLMAGDLGYTRAEVQDWIAFRHGAIHGDRQELKDLVMERDVRRFLPRMEQAAYDALFNKAVWHNASQTRREVLRHAAATTGATDIRLTQGFDCTIQSQILDPFGAYPLNLEGILNPPPRDWWYEPLKAAEGNVTS
jgi:cation transport regulator ChaB